MIVFALSHFYFVIFYYHLLEAFFLMRDRNEVNLDMRGDSKELGAIKGVKTVARIYYVKKESIFNKLKKWH